MADATANGHAELILPGWVELSKLRSNSDDAEHREREAAEQRDFNQEQERA